MNRNIQPINFDKEPTTQVNEPLLNAYGFDLTDETRIGFTHGKLRFTIFGFRPTTQYDVLIATIKVAQHPHTNDAYTHIDKLDLFITNRLEKYCREAAFQLKEKEADIKTAMFSLREQLDKFRHDELKRTDTVKSITLSKHEQKEAMFYLTSDNILESVEGLLQQAGIVTEKEKAVQLFFILLSRHFEKPLHALLQGSPQLSKMLMDVVGACVPDEQIHTYTSMAPSSMYYNTNKKSWKNNVLYITSIDKHFKGANTIKEFIENGILKRYTTEANYHTGQIYGSSKVIEGAISLMAYSNDEAMNRKFFEECFLIRLDENEKNKAALLEHYKKECGGIIDIGKQEQAVHTLRNIQRFIKPMRVVIPYAMELELPSSVNQQLRSLPQLLTFIQSVTLLHQHLLPKKQDSYGQEYIEATTEHLQAALELFKSIAISQGDKLSPTQRSFLERLKTDLNDKEKTFKLSDAMKVMEMSSSSFYREFNALKELGYVIVCGGNKKKGIDYKISDWNDYQELQGITESWKEKMNGIQIEVSQDSQKFPKKQKRLKRA
ncbi:MAG: hypothetical protein Q8M29_08740 [Bacteroidota bacterium]|nr:hypothetical protein [Bacteroidota bacterium]